MKLFQFIAQRLFLGVLTLVVIAIINFLLIRAAPGDPATVMAGEAGAADEIFLQQLRERFSLDEPILVQLCSYLAHLDLGMSHRQNKPVLELILDRLPATLLLTGSAFILSIVLGIIIGMFMNAKAGTWKDTGASVLVTVFYSTPVYWLAILSILVFSIWNPWLPAFGYESIGTGYTGLAKGSDMAFHMIQPTIVLALLLVQNSPWDMVQRPFLPPFTVSGMPLGSDALGRDMAAGIAYGARVQLFVGLSATVASLFIGITVGAVAGYYCSWIDTALMRFTEIFQVIPGVALAIVLVAIFQQSVYSIVAAIALVSWPPIARLVRSEFLTLSQREFVQAALLAGQSNFRIIVTQILSNAASSIIVMGSLMVATAILLESALRQAWWVAVFPGIAIMITVLALNLFGEGLSDGLNTRLDGRVK